MMQLPPAWTARWQALAPREQGLVRMAGAVLILALLWWVALAPAWHTLRNAPARHAALDRQLQQMQALQTEAQQLQAATPANPGGDAMGLLRNSLAQQLGNSAQLQAVGERATVTLQGARASDLARWLAEARSNARAQPVEAQLVRTPGATDTVARWDGRLVLVLALPGR